MDSQVTELLGRNQLISELLRAGLEVALPLRDRGIDLIAYADLGSDVRRFVACPIQMKAATSSSFSVETKYAKFPGLILAYIWHISDPNKIVTHALTYQEACAIAVQMGWTKTLSWTEKGSYTITRAEQNKKLAGLLEAHRMTPE